jgi:hypothetical protein
VRHWLILLLLCGATAHSAAPSNRADEYRRAYRELQARTTSDFAPLLKHWASAPPDVERFNLLSAAGPALTIAADATFLPRCDWKLRPGDLNADTSHREVVRTLVALLGMRARHGFRGTRTDIAFQDAVSAVVVARDLGRDGTLTSALIARQLESQVNGMLAEQAPQLSVKDRARLAEDLAAISPGVSLADAIVAHEQSMRMGVTQATRGARTRRQLVIRLEQFSGLRPVAGTVVADCGGTGAGVARCFQQLRSHYAAWSKWFALPPEEFAREYEKDVSGLEGNPVFRMLTPSITAVQQAEYAYKQQRWQLEEMLAAAK